MSAYSLSSRVQIRTRSWVEIKGCWAIAATGPARIMKVKMSEKNTLPLFIHKSVMTLVEENYGRPVTSQNAEPW
jgi:hypothetical protein